MSLILPKLMVDALLLVLITLLTGALHLDGFADTMDALAGGRTREERLAILADSRIGANAVVVKSVPPNSVVVGIPGQIVQRSKPHTAQDAPDLNHSQMPDLIATKLAALAARVEALEQQRPGGMVPATTSRPENGV